MNRREVLSLALGFSACRDGGSGDLFIYGPGDSFRNCDIPEGTYYTVGRIKREADACGWQHWRCVGVRDDGQPILQQEPCNCHECRI